jgi:hypothetical protein
MKDGERSTQGRLLVTNMRLGSFRVREEPGQ